MRDEPCAGSLSLLQSPNMADSFDVEATTHHLSLNYPEALTALANSMHINTTVIFITYVSYRPSLEMDTKRISMDGLLLSAALFQRVGPGPPLWSSGHSSWLQIQRSRVRVPALPNFLRSSGSGTGSTQPREDN
jgi:hypothetical protein